MAGDAPSCPRDHAGSKVVRDGVQRTGGREKQRWRCILSDGSYHRFLGAMSRTRATDETCAECENHLAPHQGPVAPAEFEYLVREIAGALVDVGRGASYTDVAKRARLRANVGKTSRLRDVDSGQTVAEWMADFVPVVSARHMATEWPAVLVLDVVSFRWTDSFDRKNYILYSILAAYGYDEDGKRGRLIKVEASPAQDKWAWEEFLSALPGTPVSIVADQDWAIRGGIESRWGVEAAGKMLHLCEYHLAENARAAMRRDGLTPADAIWGLFLSALSSREGWDAFENVVSAAPTTLNTKSWMKPLVERLRAQTPKRPRIPPVFSNGAVEAALAKVRAILERRAFAYRNRTRTNQMLELVRLAQIRADNVLDYTTDIRTHLAAHNGRPRRTYRAIYDPRGEGEAGLSSLWSLTTQLAMREARRKKEARKGMLAR